jgi:Domain of unknown function (DUF4138)
MLNLIMKTKLFVTPVLLLLSVTGWSQSSVKNEKMKFTLKTIHIVSDTFFVSLTLINQSLVGYHPSYFKFYIRDRHIAKRTAVQEKEVLPLRPVELTEVKAKSEKNIFLRLFAFTIPKTKELVIEVAEKYGSRTMSLHIPGQRLLKLVRPLSK